MEKWKRNRDGMAVLNARKNDLDRKVGAHRMEVFLDSDLRLEK